MAQKYDVIVIGAGHAGIEAGLASARRGAKTLMLTINLDNIAFMPCNPSVGGPAKGIVVREIDALGGQMAKTIDKTHIQMRAFGCAFYRLFLPFDHLAHRFHVQRYLLLVHLQMGYMA